MSTADKWADPKEVGGGTVQSKQAERDQLQRDYDAFINSGGEVKEAEEFKAAPLAESKHPAKPATTNATQDEIIKCYKAGIFGVNEIAKKTKTSRHNVTVNRDWLIDKGIVRKVKRGTYEVCDETIN